MVTDTMMALLLVAIAGPICCIMHTIYVTSNTYTNTDDDGDHYGRSNETAAHGTR